METIHWEIHALGTPHIMRHCKTCNTKQAFLSSGLFRVNANHHTLDIWLIHRCVLCGRTWNLEILERVRPQDMEPTLLRDYQENDATLAERCAHDRHLLNRAGAIADYTQVPLDITGDVVALEAPAVIVIEAANAYDIRISRILREKLGLTSSQFRRMADAGTLSCEGADIRKVKFTPGMKVRVNAGHSEGF